MLADRYHFDVDGRLHIPAAKISKAGLSLYRGREIASMRKLGLDAERGYLMLRDPDEMRRAQTTFDFLPLLSRHVPLNERPPPELVIGAIGRCRFDGEYLKAPVMIWAADAIRTIIKNGGCDLSAGYRYAPPTMTPGRFQGKRFDYAARNIEGHHIALVERGCGRVPGCSITLTENTSEKRRRFAA